jgi:hypothetical protein
VKREVVLGEADDQAVEVVSGLYPGEKIAVGNTFLLKAELEEGDPTPDTSSHRTTALHKTAQNRRAAPRRKGSRNESPSPRASKQSRVLLNVMPRVVSPVTCRA